MRRGCSCLLRPAGFVQVWLLTQDHRLNGDENLDKDQSSKSAAMLSPPADVPAEASIDRQPNLARTRYREVIDKLFRPRSHTDQTFSATEANGNSYRVEIGIEPEFPSIRLEYLSDTVLLPLTNPRLTVIYLTLGGD